MLARPGTDAALRSKDVPGRRSADGRYLVRWMDDQESFGVTGIGMLDSSTGTGSMPARPTCSRRPAPHRVLELGGATATVNCVVRPA